MDKSLCGSPTNIYLFKVNNMFITSNDKIFIYNLKNVMYYSSLQHFWETNNNGASYFSRIYFLFSFSFFPSWNFVALLNKEWTITVPPTSVESTLFFFRCRSFLYGTLLRYRIKSHLNIPFKYPHLHHYEPNFHYVRKILIKFSYNTTRSLSNHL